MQRLPLPALFFRWRHICKVTGLPLTQFQPQLRLNRLWTSARLHPADQVQPALSWNLQYGCDSIETWFGRQGNPKIRHVPASQACAVKSWRSDTNHREWMPIDLVARPYNRWIAAVFLLPHLIAHYSDGRSVLLIVGVHHHSPNPGPDTESSEEVAGNKLATPGLGVLRTTCRPHSQSLITCLERC